MPRTLDDRSAIDRSRRGFGPSEPSLAIGILIALSCVLAGCSNADVSAQPAGDGRVQVSSERRLMGTHFRIDVIVEDARFGSESIDAAFAEIERGEGTFSNWNAASQISEVNRSAGVRPVLVGDELLAVLQRAVEIAEMTGGAFDVTFASCADLWSISERRVPDGADLDACLEHVDYRKIALDHQRPAVFISDPETRLGIAGLAKGHRVDRAAEILESRGITDYVVNGGGDMRVAAGSVGLGWPISIAHPRRPTPLGTVELTGGAIATSGDYEWYFERDGVRYHHILDPASGRPARNSVSATVIAATAVDADALATGLFVMGPEAGIALAESLSGVEAMIVSPDLAVRSTSGFPALTVLGEGS